jgi:toxin CcdB
VRQFDVLENPNAETARHSPFLVVLQSHHLEPLDTVLLAPLINDARRALSPLDIAIAFQGGTYFLAVAESAGVPKARFGRTIGSVIEHEDAIRRAVERLFTGF